MRRWLLILPLSVLAATLPPMPPQTKPVMRSPKDIALQPVRVASVVPAVVQPPPHEIGRVQILYTTNTFHAIQRSLDLVNWTPVPGLENCYGPPSVSADIFSTNNSRVVFYREFGHSDFWPYSTR